MAARSKEKPALRLYRVLTSKISGDCFVRAFSDTQAQRFIKNAIRFVLRLIPDAYVEDQTLRSYTDEEILRFHHGLSAANLPNGRCAFRIQDERIEILPIN
jgi:hypothetical protein